MFAGNSRLLRTRLGCWRLLLIGGGLLLLLLLLRLLLLNNDVIMNVVLVVHIHDVDVDAALTILSIWRFYPDFQPLTLLSVRLRLLIWRLGFVSLRFLGLSRSITTWDSFNSLRNATFCHIGSLFRDADSGLLLVLGFSSNVGVFWTKLLFNELVFHDCEVFAYGSVVLLTRILLLVLPNYYLLLE